MLSALIQEAKLRKNFLAEHVQSIYLGGGTPSLYSAKEIGQLLQAIYNNYQINSHPEITLECNPENISDAYLSELKRIGITRLSIGIQSFSNAVLKSMNRSHDTLQAYKAIELSAKYFDNFSVDLMYGLPPGLGEQSFKKDLEWMLSHKIPHISLYNLTVEEHTKLSFDIDKNKTLKPSENQSRNEFEHIIKTLNKQGYNHYEISNAALPGKESKHNSAYWQRKNYLGLGPAAHSFDGKKRYNNIANNAQYIKGINTNNALMEIEILSDRDIFNELIMLGLRQKRGVDINDLKRHPKLLEEMMNFTTYRNYILTEVLKTGENFLKLQNDGIFLADKICSDLFV